MSKALTIEAIETSANEMFCRDGFDRASLREIAQRAGVSLSAIHEYFESKTALYVQVSKKLFTRLEGQRQAALETARAAGRVGLEAVVYAMIAPVALLEDGGANGWTPAQLKDWYGSTGYLLDQPQFREELRRATEGWVALMLQHCPALRHEDALFAYALISSAIMTWQPASHYINDTLELAARRAADEECALMVRFLTAGIEAVAAA